MAAQFNLNSILWNDFPQFRKIVIHKQKLCTIFYFNKLGKHLWNSYHRHWGFPRLPLCVKYIYLSVTDLLGDVLWEVWRPAVLIRFCTTSGVIWKASWIGLIFLYFILPTFWPHIQTLVLFITEAAIFEINRVKDLEWLTYEHMISMR